MFLITKQPFVGWGAAHTLCLWAPAPGTVLAASPAVSPLVITISFLVLGLEGFQKRTAKEEETQPGNGPVGCGWSPSWTGV